MNKFDEWAIIKNDIQNKNNFIKYRARDIIFMSIGENIGFEQNGKGEMFLRPVLVYKKFNHRIFLGIPLTSKEKDGKYYFEFVGKSNKKSFALLSQVKLFDIKRGKYKNGTIKEEDYHHLSIKLNTILEVTPSQKRGERAIAICDDILSKNNTNVKKVFIIAEAGVNHNGSINIAKKLIDVAVQAGANAVKFQTFKASKVVSRNTKKADYQKETTDKNESQFDMIKKLELDANAHNILIKYCEMKNIMFLSTPFDLDSIDLLNNLKLDIFKIPSGEITNLPYLEKIGSLNKKVILSTGMSNMNEIRDALSILINNGTKKENISILHANTQYPTPMEDVNLKAMQNIGHTFDISYGYSDHTLGIEVDIAAVALGATIIEKHFTLDKEMSGPDHKASLEPNELISMVKSIRNIELALGNGIKQATPSEIPNIEIVRKTIVASTNIKKGEILNEDNLTIKRAGNGISPMKWYEVIGSIASKDYIEDELI